MDSWKQGKYGGAYKWGGIKNWQTFMDNTWDGKPLCVGAQRLKAQPPCVCQFFSARYLQGLNLNIDAPQRGCGKDENGQPASLCAAVLPLGSDVLAVWIVTHKGGMKEVERDAGAIKTFTKYAISEVENYQAFKQGIEFLKN